jgi:hypothetical protein
MSEIAITISELRGMLGKRVNHENKVYQIIEVIEHSHEIVLLPMNNEMYIQPDQHGDAHRRVPNAVTIPALTADKQELHPAFLALVFH